MPISALHIEDKDVIQALEKLRQRTDNMHPAYNGIGRVVKSLIQFGYRTGTDPYGSKWEALDPRGRQGQPLRDKGNLRDAWHFRANDEEVELANNRTVSYKGKDYSLAAIHHFGAVIKPRPDGPGYLRWLDAAGEDVLSQKSIIPARKQIPDSGWPDDWREDVFDVIDGFMQHGRA